MTNAEFATWWTDLKTRLPSVKRFISSVTASEDEAKAMLATWRGVLADVSLSDALAVTAKMQDGTLAWLEEGTSIDKLPAHVRRLAKREAYEARPRQPEPLEDFKPAPSAFAGLIRRVIELRESGLPSEEAKAQALKEMPPGPANYEPRYECHLCQDSGRIEVASNHAILAMLRGQFEACHHRTGIMRCSCYRGRNIIRKSGGRDVPLERFDELKDYRVIDPTWGESTVAHFGRWCEERKEQAFQERMASYQWTPETSRHGEHAHA
jgi:hypothetical protein